jgi:hydroxyacylglutathione hydrolase
MSFAIAIAAAPDRPWGVFTGDALFIGDTGRTDLADANKTAENAGLLYDQVHAKILPLGDQTLVLPAHGAGSACGGSVADRDHSTIGIERATNAVAVKSREDFIRHKTAEKLGRPPYFRLMEEVNLHAGRPFDDVPVPWLRPHEFAERCGEGLVIDARDVEAYAGGHIGGSYSIWLPGIARYGGWVTDDTSPVYLLADTPGAVHEARLSLARIGRDRVAGALAGGFEAWRDAGLPIEKAGTTTPREVAARLGDITVLDVRETGEFDRGRIPGARHVFVGHLEKQLSRLDLRRHAPVVVTCSVGHRGSLAASILKRNGYGDVYNLLGGMAAWKMLRLPVEGANADALHAQL